MKRVINTLGFISLLAIGIVIFVIFLPFMLAMASVSYFQRKRFEKKYALFLFKNNGKNFFCYNNRKNAKYIEEEIIPGLADGVEIVYLNGKSLQTNCNAEFISEALYQLKNYNRFPHIMKIRNGQLIDKSINNPFYNVLNLNKPKNELLRQVNLFFEQDALQKDIDS